MLHVKADQILSATELSAARPQVFSEPGWRRLRKANHVETFKVIGGGTVLRHSRQLACTYGQVD